MGGKIQVYKGCRNFFVYKLGILWYTTPISVRQADLSTKEMLCVSLEKIS